MVRKKQQHPYHGTKEHIDTMENTTPLVANFLKLPQRTLPPLLRFAVIMKQSSDPEGTKNKILEEGMEYELTQGDEVQRSLKEMSVLELRTALKDLGLKVTGKKQDLVNRLIGAQSTKGKDRNGRRESKTQKVKGSVSPTSPVSTSPPPSADAAKTAKEEETNVAEQVESKEVVKKEDEPLEPKEESKESDEKKEEVSNESASGETRSLPEGENKEADEDEDDDEESESTSPYAKLKVTELRNELRKRGLNTAGRKDELIDRLEADNAASTGKSTPPSNSQEKIEVSNAPQVDPVSESDPVSPTGSASVSTPPAAVSTSPPTNAKLSPTTKSAKRNSLAIADSKAKRKSATQGGSIDSEEEEEDSSDVIDDDDTDEYDDGESRRKKKPDGSNKGNKGGKGKGGRRDSRTAKRRRRDF